MKNYKMEKNRNCSLFIVHCSLAVIGLLFVIILTMVFGIAANNAYANDEVPFIRSVFDVGATRIVCNLFAADNELLVFVEARIDRPQPGDRFSIKGEPDVKFASRGGGLYVADIFEERLSNFTIVFHTFDEDGEAFTEEQHITRLSDIDFDRIQRYNEQLRNLNQKDYADVGWQRIVNAAGGLQHEIVLPQVNSNQIAEFSRILDAAIKGDIRITDDINRLPEGFLILGAVRFSAPDSSIGIGKGGEVVFVIDRQARNNAQIQTVYENIKDDAKMPDAGAFNFNLSLKDRHGDAPIGLVGAATIRVGLPEHTVKAVLYFSPEGGGINLVAGAQIIDGYLVATVTALGDFFLLAQVQVPNSIPGVWISGRFYPWSILGGTIGGVAGLIGIAVVVVIIIQKKKKQSHCANDADVDNSEDDGDGDDRYKGFADS